MIASPSTLDALRRGRRERGAAARRVLAGLLAASSLVAPALAASELSLGSSAASPVSSARAASRFSLGIEAALAAARLEESIQLAAAPRDAYDVAAYGPRTGVRQLRPSDLDDLALLHRRQQTTSDQGVARRGGFGRWLKRHWWAPVLVGVAAGVVIADSGGDDDRFGEDD